MGRKFHEYGGGNPRAVDEILFSRCVGLRWAAERCYARVSSRSCTAGRES